MRTRYRKRSLLDNRSPQKMMLDTPAAEGFATKPATLYDFIEAGLSVF